MANYKIISDSNKFFPLKLGEVFEADVDPVFDQHIMLNLGNEKIFICDRQSIADGDIIRVDDNSSIKSTKVLANRLVEAIWSRFGF